MRCSIPTPANTYNQPEVNVMKSRVTQYIVVAIAAVAMAGVVTYVLNRLGF